MRTWTGHTRAHTCVISIWDNTHTHVHTPFGQQCKQRVVKMVVGQQEVRSKKCAEGRGRGVGGKKKAQLAAFYADPCQATKHT